MHARNTCLVGVLFAVVLGLLTSRAGALDIGAHKCAFDPNSSLLLLLQIAPIPLSPSGSLDIDCGVVDPNSGKAACTCVLQSIDPLSIPSIGFVCLTPSGACPAGEIDCDGGNGLDVDLESNHNIGVCTGNADCFSQCTSYCSTLEPEKSFFSSGCEGFCAGGVSDGLACFADSGCLGGACNGGDSVDPNTLLPPHGNICGCDCLEVDGAASASGGLQCNLGTRIVVETASPCDAEDVTIDLGTRCIPMTTETVEL